MATSRFGGTPLGQQPRDRQDIPLLKTKLYIPPVRPERVLRPRLVERLNAALDRKVTLISAPAGFGKTTLLSEWVAGCTRHTRVAWVSLDTGDNDLPRFWSYVIAALQTVHAGVGAAVLSALQMPQALPNETLLAELVNETTEIPEPLALILDDFHVITNSQVSEALALFLENLPPQMHLIVATRADPPWPLARLRARSQMIELRANDLRFTPEETAAFLNDVMGLDLSPEDVTALDARTEGWIAGLQMAALSMQGRQDVAAFIRAFSGSHRFVLDYLVEEVLDGQSPATREFLFKTSILERMTASLCDAVTGRDDGHAVLAQLEQANLFLSPLDDERHWYRYHHLFSDLLRGRLEQAWPDQLATLHCQASIWYEENGWIAEAMSHAFAADDVERVARLVEANAFTMLDLSEMATLKRWLEGIPDKERHARSWLGIAHAWVLVYAGQLEAAEDVLLQPEKALMALEDVEQRRISGHISAIRAYAAYIRGQGESAEAFARQALAQLPEDELVVRTFTATTLGGALIQCDDLAGASLALYDAIALGRASGNVHVYMLAASSLAYLLMLQGRLHEAEAVCRKALAFAHDQADRPRGRSPAIAQVYALLSAVLLTWNELEQAVALAREGLELNKRWGQADTLTVSYIHLANALRAAGDLEGALAAVQQAKWTSAAVSGWFDIIVGSMEARLNLSTGNLAAAVRWAEERGMDYRDAVAQPSRNAYRTLARILIAQGKLGEASHLLNRLIEAAQAAEATGFLVSVLPLQSIVLAEQGQETEALAVLDRALGLAEPERIMNPFLALGESIVPMLQKAAVHGTAPGFARELLAALETKRRAAAPHLDRDRGARKTIFPESQQWLAESLSERELEVLRLLATSLSSTEIAQELFISPHTVRSHIKSIYSKLDVHSRMAAVQRAEDLGLL